MSTPEFNVPAGTKLEVVYSTKRTSSFTVAFAPDEGPSQLLVSEAAEGESGDFVPFLLLTRSGTVKLTTTGVSINNANPEARTTLCASPYFMSKIVLFGPGTRDAVVRIAVDGGAE